ASRTIRWAISVGWTRPENTRLATPSSIRSKRRSTTLASFTCVSVRRWWYHDASAARRFGRRAVLRASGGIGRRAGFRFLWGNTRGGSSPPSPTVSSVHWGTTPQHPRRDLLRDWIV